MDHQSHNHTKEPARKAPAEKNQHPNNFRLALSATWHCLVGCGFGEVSGMIIATIFGLNMINSMILAIILGFIGGFALGIIPLLRADFSFKQAFKTVLIAEGLSILVMEAFEVGGTQVMIPGVIEAGLTDMVFWFGMVASLMIGFIAAFPVDYVLIKRGVWHHH